MDKKTKRLLGISKKILKEIPCIDDWVDLLKELRNAVQEFCKEEAIFELNNFKDIVEDAIDEPLTFVPTTEFYCRLSEIINSYAQKETQNGQ